MQSVTPLQQREVETYFSVLADGVNDRTLQARAYHNLGKYEAGDFRDLSALLDATGADGSIAVLGRDAEERADIIEDLHANGHELVLHGHRHVGCSDLPAELARENVMTGVEAIESAAGVTPAGFFAPLQRMNTATVEAVADAGMDWVFGQPEGTVPDDLDVIEPANPYDLGLLGDGYSPTETFDRLAEQAESGSNGFLVHPNMLEYFDAMAAFEEWLREYQPTSVGTAIAEGGIGMVLDCLRPLKIE
ncbi:MAG: polysaccharide deacetylase family protein [Halobacteriales archaeon]|nr:polysaccharide deacetylase family protein [Halobacteriales archaeon]